MPKGFKDLLPESSGMKSSAPLPSVHIDSDSVEGSDKWTLGDMFTIKARMVSRTDRVGDAPSCMDFDIIEVKPSGKPSKDEVAKDEALKKGNDDTYAGGDEPSDE